ncbi:hypothetical protein [Burkholderia gladioli]|uniref:hypothetical protein n=1 Tax=Burkholderia gladioli TaxID=28095 RepID=UPI002FE2B896
MRSKSRFAEDLRAHVRTVLLSDELIELAYAAGLDRDEITDRLWPLLTRQPPFRAQALLHAISPDPRETVAFMGTLLDEFASLAEWRATGLRSAAMRVASLHGLGARHAEMICSCWMLFGPSPLDPFASMQVFGREATLARCEQALRSFSANLMVS